MKALIFIFIFQSAFAAGGTGEVPAVVFYQALNLSILLAILTYFLKDKVRDYFKSKKEGYLKVANEVETLKKQAQEQARILKDKIAKIEQTSGEAMAKAERESKEFNQRLISEAKAQAEKLKSDTDKTIKIEIFKAIDTLRGELIDDSVASSRELIQKQIKETDQKRLQNEFVEKIGVVEQ